MAALDTGRPAGKPSMIATRAEPCDSPAVRNLSPAMHPSSHREEWVLLLEDLLAFAERELVVAEQHGGAASGGAHELEVVGERLALACRVDGGIALDLRGRALLSSIDVDD